jgi:hypothetical protein
MGSPSSYEVSKSGTARDGRRASAFIIAAALKRNSKNLKKKRQDSEKKVEKKRRDSAVKIAQFVKKNSGKVRCPSFSCGLLCNHSPNLPPDLPSLSSPPFFAKKLSKGESSRRGRNSKAVSPTSRNESKRASAPLTPRTHKGKNESKRRGSAMLIQKVRRLKTSTSPSFLPLAQLNP